MQSLIHPFKFMKFFNMEYYPKVKDVFFFFQDKVLSYPDSNVKQSSMY